MNINFNKAALSLAIDNYEEMNRAVMYTDYDQFVIEKFIDKLKFLLDTQLIRWDIQSIELSYCELQIIYDIMYSYEKRK